MGQEHIARGICRPLPHGMHYCMRLSSSYVFISGPCDTRTRPDIYSVPMRFDRCCLSDDDPTSVPNRARIPRNTRTVSCKTFNPVFVCSKLMISRGDLRLGTAD